MRIGTVLPGLAEGLMAAARLNAPREACGLVRCDGSIAHLENRAKDPTCDFNIGPLKDLPRDCLAVWHTHPDESPPSDCDRYGCQASGLPWVVAGPSRIWVLFPRPQPYLNREFAYGVDDCWQLVSDWWAGERRVLFPWFRRPVYGWWETPGLSPYLLNAAGYGFQATPVNSDSFKNLKTGDVLLMQIRGKRPNHAAVYVGGGEILHHLVDSLSTTEQLSSAFQRFTTHICRYEACS